MTNIEERSKERDGRSLDEILLRGKDIQDLKDPQDFKRAMRELNGKYIGNRPVKLGKSNWKDRNIDIVKSKQKLCSYEMKSSLI